MIFRALNKWYRFRRLGRYLSADELDRLASRLDEMSEWEAFEWLFMPRRVAQRSDPNFILTTKNTLARVAKDKAANDADKTLK